MTATPLTQAELLLMAEWVSEFAPFWNTNVQRVQTQQGIQNTQGSLTSSQIIQLDQLKATDPDSIRVFLAQYQGAKIVALNQGLTQLGTQISGLQDKVTSLQTLLTQIQGTSLQPTQAQIAAAALPASTTTSAAPVSTGTTTNTGTTTTP